MRALRFGSRAKIPNQDVIAVAEQGTTCWARVDGALRLLRFVLGWHYCTVADMVTFETHAWHDSRGVGRQGSWCSISVELPRSSQTRGNVWRRRGEVEEKEGSTIHRPFFFFLVFPKSQGALTLRQPSSSRQTEFWFCLRLVVVVR